MFHNFIKVLGRNLKRAPLYFFINLFGLSVGMASCVIILHYVAFESNYDQFHENKENIYRINVSDNGGVSAQTPPPVGPFVKEDFEQINSFVWIRPMDGQLKLDDTYIDNSAHSIVFSSADYFNVFSQQIISGNPEDLSKPNTIYLSQSLADKLFPGKEPINQSIILNEKNFGEKVLKVVGIMDNPRSDTHLPLSAIISLKTIENNDQFWAKFDNWGWVDFYTYVKTTGNATIEQAELNEFLDRKVGKENRIEANLEIQLQAVTAIHLDNSTMNNYLPSKDPRLLSFLAVVGGFILFMACINYVNLTTARGIKRAKEVGIRKNLGATRKDLIWQFSIEALLINGMAVVLAFTLIQGFWPVLHKGIGGAFAIGFWEQTIVLYSVFIPVLVAMLWTILQPAWVISSYSMVSVLKGKIDQFGKGKWSRNTAVVIQFTISLTLMIVCVIMYQQISYMQNKDLGINIDQKIIVSRPLEGAEQFYKKADAFKTELKKIAGIDDVSISGSVPGEGYNYATNNFKRLDREKGLGGDHGIYITYIDNDFATVYEPELLFGKTTTTAMDQANTCLVNLKALANLDIDTPEEAVGMHITDGNTELEILGVINNYLHQSVKQTSDPVLYRFEQNPQFFSIAYNTGINPLGATSNILDEVEAVYQAIFPDTNFNYHFLDQKFALNYEFEKFFGRLLLIFTGLAIFLAILGLYGLSLFNLERKTKEVGIRKTLGAVGLSLLVTNLKPYIHLFIIGAVIALPVSYYLGDFWLADYPFKVEIAWFSYLIPLALLVVISMLTISYHIYILNKTNPVESLRYE